MEEALRQFSSSGIPSTSLTTILGLWLIWPLLCGVLGASRGQAFSGAMNGLLWGPFGLLFVLLKSKKHICPTCGQRTLHQPIDHDPYRPKWHIPPVVTPAAAADVPPLAINVPPPPPPQPVAVGVDVANDPEAVKLRAWVAGDPD